MNLNSITYYRNESESCATRQSTHSRINNLVQLMPRTIVQMFRIENDGIPRGEVKRLSASTLSLIQTLGLKTYAAELVEPMLQPDWQPDPSGLVAIPKHKGGHRFLAPPTDADRIRQRAIYKLVDPRLAHLFSRNSYGFRTGCSAQQAVCSLGYALNRPDFDTLILFDVVRCFPSLPVARVMQEFKTFIGDRTLLHWIELYLRNRPPRKLVNRITRNLSNDNTLTVKDSENLNTLLQRRIGVPEGSALSPLACNLYMRHMIAHIEGHMGDAVLVHYADNIAILGRSDCLRSYCGLVKEAARQLGLTVAEPEVIARGGNRSGEFLGYSVGWRNGSGHLGMSPASTARLISNLHCANNPAEPNDVRKAIIERVLPALSYYRYANQDELLGVCRQGIAGYPEEDRGWAWNRLYTFICGNKTHEETELAPDTWFDVALSLWGEGQHTGAQTLSVDRGASKQHIGCGRSFPLAPLATTRPLPH